MALFKKISRLITTQFTIDQFFHEKDVFFILGMGRSGTKLLSNLLNQDESSLIFHEPVRKDFEEIVERNDDYLRERKKILYHRIKNIDFDIYGEANSNLRYHTGQLLEYFPDVRLIHNVRDGRDVVRSVMSRDHYTDDGIGHHSIKPQKKDPLYDRWEELSRFEKICWLWKDAVVKTDTYCNHTIHFEKWTQDYDYFEENILQMTGITVTEEQWSDAMNTPNNQTRQYAIPHWRNWKDEYVRAFQNICGNQLEEYGYTWD